MKPLPPWRLFVGGLLIGFSIGVFCERVASADHNIYLPYVPNTPLMQQVITQQEYTWCADTRASAYPGFVDQLRDVEDQYTALVGIRNRQVAFSDSSCQVRHTMPDVVDCSGCAAYIHYASWPVTIVYKWDLGYFDWRSAQGHELGHGLLGLHEQYKDSGGTIGCTFRADTVMSCGPPYVRYPQPLDVTRGCGIIQTSWCGVVAPPADCSGPTDVFGNVWDSCLGRWRSPFTDWLYDPATGVWELPDGTPEWSGCNGDSLRWNFYIGAWAPVGSGFFVPIRGFWSFAPPC